MLRQSIPPHQQPLKSSSSSSDNDDLNISRALLLDIIQENHSLYHMEKRDRPNNIIRVLVELHQLGATQEQLSLAYQYTRHETQLIRPSNKINESNWKEYLGTSSLYSDYLVFFDNQLSSLGLQETLNTYFYSIPNSIGSQLQPLVQLSFGIEHNLPQIITQALAYYATSYLDVSNIMDYCQDHSVTTKSVQHQQSNIANKILFDFIASDQRFDGKIEGNNTFHSSVKLLIKSKYDLIKTYMTTWSTLSSNLSLEQRLDTLLTTAVTLAHKSSRQQGNSIELDWFMAGGQLIDSVFAIKKLIRANNDTHFINLLFLSILSTFVVQGRPTQSIHMEPKMNWESCISTIIQSAQPKSILALVSILKVTQHVDSEPLLYLELANTLAQFVLLDGTWVKGGLGWSK
ncbi:hypothetical protein BDF21DRAFT_462148 [Thamnidium elegans]|nr:hypothetical protein BDF21DRAFT_462148 [Thamnidium elegans]